MLSTQKVMFEKTNKLLHMISNGEVTPGTPTKVISKKLNCKDWRVFEITNKLINSKKIEKIRMEGKRHFKVLNATQLTEQEYTEIPSKKVKVSKAVVLKRKSIPEEFREPFEIHMPSSSSSIELSLKGAPEDLAVFISKLNGGGAR